MKKLVIFFLIALYCSAKTADITATLDSMDGSTSFTLYNSDNLICATVNSLGNSRLNGTMEIKGTGNSHFVGRLGIGITNPTEKLEVDGALKIGNASGTENGTIRFTGTDFEARKSGAWVSLTESGDFKDGGENSGTDRSLGNTDNYDLGFKTNNLVRLHIENNGCIGIGTTDPGDSLEISGTASVSKSLQLKGGLRLDSAGISCATAEMLIVDGKTGIGITDPSYALEVAGTVEAIAFSGNGSQLTGISAVIDYPEHATLWHCDSTKVTGNNLEIRHEADAVYFTYTFQNPAANGNTFKQSFILQAGTYLFEVLGFEDDDCGKVDWYIDDVLKISGQDWYANFGYYDYKTAEITITDNGEHILKGVVNGKNGSSSGYNIKLIKMWLK